MSVSLGTFMNSNARSAAIGNLIEKCLGDLTRLIENHVGTEVEDKLFSHLEVLLRDIYRVSPESFDQEIVSKIRQIQIRYKSNKEKPSLSSLPFREGETYCDRQGRYTVLESSGGVMNIQYEDGTQMRVSTTAINIKERIHSNIEKEAVKNIASDTLLRALDRGDIVAESLIKKLTTSTRTSHCYSCKETVDPMCNICLLCGWYSCSNCEACGCGYRPYQE